MGAVSQAYLRDLEAWLIADLEADEAPDSVAILLDTLASRATSPLNVTRTAKDLAFGSHSRLERRINRLIATFAAIECPQRNDLGEAVSGAQSKYYLADPILAWLPSRLRSALPEPSLTALTKMAIGTSLASVIECLEEGRLAVGDTIGYTKTESGQEVDFSSVCVATASGSSATTPVEGKWVSHGWRTEAKVIENKYDGGVLATRNVLDLNHAVWAVPAPMVSLLLR